jgi:hypothetical protein
VLAFLRQRTLPVITVLASVPLLFSFQLKAPPAYLKGYFFVFAWTWGIFGALLAPLCVVLECVALLWLYFGQSVRDRSVLLMHILAVLIATAGLLVLWAARQSHAV